MTDRAVTVLPSSRAVSRRVGPLAWVLLEELALRAGGGPNGLAVETSIRELGATLNIGKDTIAKALRRLADLGLIQPQGQRIAGRYAGCAYIVDVDACQRAGVFITEVAVVTAPRPVAPCPVKPDVAGGEPADPILTDAADAPPSSAAAWADQELFPPSLFDSPDQPSPSQTPSITRSPDRSTTPSSLSLQTNFPTPRPPSLTRSYQPDGLAPEVRRRPVNVAGARAGGRSALNGNLDGEAGSGC
jgi:hypothetical protein